MWYLERLLERYYELRRILDTSIEPITIYEEGGNFWLRFGDKALDVLVLKP